jgi:NADH dehydrogenase (ubiquinone) 1 alpha subcomplex subunit 12
MIEKTKITYHVCMDGWYFHHRHHPTHTHTHHIFLSNPTMSLVRFIRNMISSGRRFPRNLYYLNDAKPAGRLMGEDELGNKYYESTEEIWARQRWVESPSNDFDPSSVSAKWHAWLHRIIDTSTEPTHPMTNRWLAPHTPNYTGTPGAYRPYNTTAPKIQAWQGKPTERV